MQIDLLSGDVRLILWLLVAACASAAGLLAWRKAPAERVVTATSLAAIAFIIVAGEKLIGLIVAAAAPDTAQFNEHRWVLMAPWDRAGLLAGVLCAALAVLLSYLAARRLASPWRRAGLVGLRAGAALAALILFLEPAVELRQVAREPNRVAVLVDDSASMSLRDQGGGPSRSELARALIDESSQVFESWRKSHHIDFYSFSDALVPTTEAKVATAEPTGKATLIRLALEQLRSRYQGPDLAGIVLLSDGVGTGDFAEGAGTGASRDFLRSLDTRVHTVWTARKGLKDVAIARVLSDEFAFARTVVGVDVVVRSTGYGPRRIPVVLSSDGKPLRRKWVDVPAGAQEVTTSFEFTPAKVGKYAYEISTPVADDEAVAENNSRSFVLRVIRDKIRVLQVAGQPSWDVRALRGLLKQNPNVDLISFFILRTQNDISNASNDELSLIPFPTHELFEEQLPSFDLIVLQNFDYLPYGIAPYLDNIKAYVEGGGGLVMLGGAQSFASGGYGGTPVADVLPVLLSRGLGATSDLIDTEPFQPELTRAGRVHPITALRFEPSDNAAAWKSLPPLSGINKVVGARKSAQVLAVHPRLKTERGEPMPLIAAWQAGEGRGLAITTDSLWRWGFVAAARPGDDGRAYFKLWENAIRWLMDDPDLRYIRIDTDKVEYGPSDEIALSAHLLDHDYRPKVGGEIAIEVHRGSDPTAADLVAETSLTTGEGGEAGHQLAGQPPGVYRVTARATVGGRRVEAQDIFLVRDASDELAHPAPSEDLLTVIAETTGGRHLGTAERLPRDLDMAQPRVVRVDRRADVELWSRGWLLALALALFALEWGLRGRIGYL